MPPASRPSLPAIIATAAFAILSLLGAWLILLNHGFSHAPYRTSRDFTFVSGAPALLMAALQLLAATLALAWLLRLKLGNGLAMAVAIALAFGPAAVYWLGQGA